MRRHAGLVLVAALLVACGDRGADGDSLPTSCDALTERLDAHMTAFRSRLDDSCASAADCTGVRYDAHRGDVTCLESDSCFLPVKVASADDLVRYLDADPGFGAICLRMHATDCSLPIPYCGPVAPVCEDGRCNLVVVADP